MPSGKTTTTFACGSAAIARPASVVVRNLIAPAREAPEEPPTRSASVRLPGESNRGGGKFQRGGGTGEAGSASGEKTSAPPHSHDLPRHRKRLVVIRLDPMIDACFAWIKDLGDKVVAGPTPRAGINQGKRGVCLPPRSPDALDLITPDLLATSQNTAYGVDSDDDRCCR